MKNSFKGFIACLLALLLVIPAFTGVFAETESAQSNGIIKAKHTVSVDVSGIRNGKTIKAAETAEVEEVTQPDDIVTIMVALDAKPALEVYESVKAAGSYRDELLADQLNAVKKINAALDLDIEVLHNYTVLFNGFAFEGEYRLVEELNKLGVKAYAAVEWASPKLFNTTTQVGAVEAWDLDYTGEGTVVAIIDTGCKVDHPAFQTMPENVKFTKEYIGGLINEGNLQGGSRLNVENVYYNAKIPFRWNYITNTYNVNHTNSDHGTHCAGIAAGNGGEIKGIAPDAQIAVMQVFGSNGGANWSNILAALEDCVILGVDSANMSLGTPCASEDFFVMDDLDFSKLFENLTNAGVNLAMACGNDYDASCNNAWGDNYDPAQNAWSYDGYNLVENPDSGVVGAPAVWQPGIAVAAVNNEKIRTVYLEVEGKYYGYSENETDNSVLMVDALGGETLEYVVVPGFGDVADYEGIDVEGKIALVSRGNIDFTAKATNAEEHGAVACIVYNNQDESVRMVGYTGGIPNVIITRKDGEALIAAQDKHMFVSDGVGIVDQIGGNEPCAFSSRGVPSTLALKPEITAPGGQIYSATDPAISGGYYEAWDGTSMATPHVNGGMAIVSQFVSEKFPNADAAERERIVNAILMSTATPINDAGGSYAFPRTQGAGELNVGKAVKTTAYLTVDGTYGNRPKVELGDDPDKTGSYTLTFKVHNFGTTELSYTIQPSLLLDDLAILGYLDEEGTKPVIVFTSTSWDIAKEVDVIYGDINGNGNVETTDALDIARYAMGLTESIDEALADCDGNGSVSVEDSLQAIRVAMGLVEPEGSFAMTSFDMPEIVTVPANSEKEVKVVINLTDAAKEYLNEYYTSGAYIEGFIELIPVEEDGVSLTLPYLGFYGDWNYAPTIDTGYYYENEEVRMNSGLECNTIGYRKNTSDDIHGLGLNPFIDPGDLEYYYADRNAISPNADGVLDTVNVMYTNLLRNSYVRYVVLDATGEKELGVINDYDVCTKGFWDTKKRDQLGVSYGQFPVNFDFTQYGEDDIIIRIEAKLDNDGRRTASEFTTEASARWCWDTPVHIDTEAPEAKNLKFENGQFSFDAVDEHYVAYAAVYTNDEGNLGDVVEELGVFQYNRGESTSVVLSGGDNNFVVVGDYAGNVSAYLYSNGSFEKIEVQQPGTVIGHYDDGVIGGYGLNLENKGFLAFDTTDILSGGYIEDTPSGLDITAAAYDTANGYVYAIDGNKDLYRYTADLANRGLYDRTKLGTLQGDYGFNEMAYNPQNGLLYAVCGAAEVYTIKVDANSFTQEKLFTFNHGIVAMDFTEDGRFFLVDGEGWLDEVDLDAMEAKAIGESGVTPINMDTGSFYNQSGCIIGNTFYWNSIDVNLQSLQLVRFDCDNGACEHMGRVLDEQHGLQVAGMFYTGFEQFASASSLSTEGMVFMAPVLFN